MEGEANGKAQGGAGRGEKTWLGAWCRKKKGRGREFYSTKGWWLRLTRGGGRAVQCREKEAVSRGILGAQKPFVKKKNGGGGARKSSKSGQGWVPERSGRRGLKKRKVVSQLTVSTKRGKGCAFRGWVRRSIKGVERRKGGHLVGGGGQLWDTFGRGGAKCRGCRSMHREKGTPHWGCLLQAIGEGRKKSKVGKDSI